MMIVHFHLESTHKQLKRASKGKNLGIFNNFCWIRTNMFKTKKWIVKEWLKKSKVLKGKN